MRYALLLLLAGCATGPTRYDRLQWANTSIEQANAECMMELDKHLLASHTTCMEAKGWRRR